MPEKYLVIKINAKGHAVMQLSEGLRYKPEGSDFDSRWHQ
jgi:hypothetical protein